MTYSSPLGGSANTQESIVVVDSGDSDTADVSVTLARLTEAYATRSTAIADSDTELAEAALRSMVTHLTRLWDLVEADLETDYHRKDLKHVKKQAKRRIVSSDEDYRPLTDIATLLDLSAEQTERVTGELRRNGQLDSGTRQEAIERLGSIRERLDEIHKAADDDELEPFVQYGVRLAHALIIASAGTITGPLVEPESEDEALLLETMITAAVAVSLRDDAEDIARDDSDAEERRDDAKETLTALAEELDAVTDKKDAPYSPAPPMGRIRLLVAIYRAEEALLTVRWPAKPECEESLTKLGRRLRKSPRIKMDQLRELNEELKDATASLDRG